MVSGKASAGAWVWCAGSGSSDCAALTEFERAPLGRRTKSSNAAANKADPIIHSRFVCILATPAEIGAEFASRSLFSLHSYRVLKKLAGSEGPRTYFPVDAISDSSPRPLRRD